MRPSIWFFFPCYSVQIKFLTQPGSKVSGFKWFRGASHNARGQEAGCFRICMKVNRVDLYCLVLFGNFLLWTKVTLHSVNKHSDNSKTHIQLKWKLKRSTVSVLHISYFVYFCAICICVTLLSYATQIFNWILQTSFISALNNV